MQEKGEFMDFNEKARIRLGHWVNHSEEHQKEYDGFSRELENAGRDESAGFIRELAKLTEKSTEYLKKALAALDK